MRWQYYSEMSMHASINDQVDETQQMESVMDSGQGATAEQNTTARRVWAKFIT